jgi:hypothetical protein
MALQKTFPRFGHNFTTAYHRITGLDIDAQSSVVNIEVKIWKDNAARQANEQEVAILHYPISNVDASGNPTNNFDNFVGAKLNAIGLPDPPNAKVSDALIRSIYVYLKSEVAYYGDAADV